MNDVSELLTIVETLFPGQPITVGVKRLERVFSKLENPQDLKSGLDWLESLNQWLKVGGVIPDLDRGAQQSSRGRTARLTFFFECLKLNSIWSENFQATVHRVCVETSARRLLTNTGLGGADSLIGQLVEHVLQKTLPQPPDDSDLGEVLLRVFPSKSDAMWFDDVDPELVMRFLEMAELYAQTHGLSSPTEHLRRSAIDSIQLLSARVVGLGLADDILQRSQTRSVAESPFHRLNQATTELVTRLRGGEEIGDLGLKVDQLVTQCREEIKGVFNHLDQYGVSVNLVFRLELAGHTLDRIDALNALLTSTMSHGRLCQFIAKLLRDGASERSAIGMMRANLHQLSRKIVESAGKSGGYYIARDRAGYFALLKSAAGGGVLTALTTFFKFVVEWVKAPLFVEGILASANYAGSFLVMQAAGFTLATKQPAMTAATIAHAVKDSEASSLDPLVEQIACTFRSQFAAALGNVGMVVPTVLALNLAIFLWQGEHFLDIEKSEYVVASLHPWESATILYAAFTGAILWFASVCGGWVLNWVVYRRLPEAISKHRRLSKLMGVERTERLGVAFSKNISGIAVNVVLGTMLAMIPIFSQFVGLPIQVRHVTLSAGALTFAGATQGWDVFLLSGFWYAWLGILLIGLLNFGVSFALALALAIRSTIHDHAPWLALTVAVFRRMVETPLDFFRAPKEIE